MIVALPAENARISATLRAHDPPIQTLWLRIARLGKQVVGPTCFENGASEKIGREIGHLQLTLEDLMIAAQMKVVQTARLEKSCRRDEKMVQVPAPSSPPRQHGGRGSAGPCAGRQIR